MDIGAQTGANPVIIGAVFIGALIFGTGYALLIAHLKRNGRLNGFTSFAVVGGVMATLTLAIPIIGIQAALFTGLVFIFTGIPMMVGDVWVYTSDRATRANTVRSLFVKGTDET